MKRYIVTALVILLTVCPLTYGSAHATSSARLLGSSQTGGVAASGGQSGEVVSLRTQYSRTYAENGHYKAVISAGPMNYRDANGKWQPIDSSLVPSSDPAYAFQNKANAFTVRFPSDIGGGPIHVESGAGSVGFSLVGAAGTGSVSGATYTYAMAGVTAAFTANPGGVKEALTLQSPGSPSNFTYKLQMSSGLTAEQNSAGGVDILDASGARQFSFAAPFMYDAAHVVSRAASLKLSSSPAGQLLTLSTDATWLADPARKWPVVIDPTITVTTVHDSQDCTINDLNADSSACGQGYVTVGADPSGGHDRAVMAFSVSSIPAMSQVLNAQLSLSTYATGGCCSEGTEYHQLTTPWGAGATWNSPWTTPGGDFMPNVANLTQTVQSWVSDPTTNDGLLLKWPDDGAYGGYVEYYSAKSGLPPKLTVDYTPRLGTQGYYPMLKQTLSPSADLAVNLGNGNLVLHISAIQMPGDGLPLSLGATFNSLGTSGYFGNGWQLDAGPDISLITLADGSMAYSDGTGAMSVFAYDPLNGYIPPPGVDAQLTGSSRSGWTMTFNQSQLRYKFDTKGHMTSEVDRSGNTISFNVTESSSSYVLNSITDTQGRATTVSGSYTFTDPAGRTYAFDDSGWGPLVNSYTDPAGKMTSFGYDGNGLVTSITDPNGNVTDVTYDTSFRVSSIKRVTNPSTGDGYTWTVSYNSGQTVVTDPNNHATTYAYDGTDDLSSVTDPDGHKTQMAWTGDLQPAQETLPSNAKTTYTYDANNNRTKETLPNNATSTCAYAVTGQPYNASSCVDTQGNKTTYGYDSAGRLTSVTDPYNKVTQYGLNTDGTTASVTDANGNVTSYSYGPLGGLVSQITYTSPLGSKSYTYNADNSVATETDGKGQTTTYTYDLLDRVTRVTTTNAGGSAGPSVSYTYDADGNRLSMTDGTGTTTYVYDRLNRLTQETLPNAQVISYTYDGVGNMLTKTDSGGPVTYGYNAENWLTSVQEPSGQLTSIGYDVDGNRTEIDFPSGVVEAMTYTNELLTQIKATKGTSTLTYRSYTYNGTLLSYMDDGSYSTGYGYDKLNRLTDATGANTYTYVYDAVGNMTSKTVNGTTTTMSYNGANELTQAGSTTYSYDGDGNVTGQSTGMGATYNALNQTTSMTPAGGRALNFGYTDRGQTQRTSVIDTSTGGTTTYQYDATGVGAQTQSGASSSTYFTRTPSGDLLEERIPANSTGCTQSSGYCAYYYLLDAQGSVIAVTDGSGTVKDQYSYDPYGNVVGTPTEQVPNPFRYIGAVWDARTSVYKVGQRYYDASLSRFTQVDPAACDSSSVDYRYAADDPINGSDPSGALAYKHDGDVFEVCFGMHELAHDIHFMDRAVWAEKIAEILAAASGLAEVVIEAAALGAVMGFGESFMAAAYRKCQGYRTACFTMEVHHFLFVVWPTFSIRCYHS